MYFPVTIPFSYATKNSAQPLPSIFYNFKHSRSSHRSLPGFFADSGGRCSDPKAVPYRPRPFHGFPWNLWKRRLLVCLHPNFFYFCLMNLLLFLTYLFMSFIKKPACHSPAVSPGKLLPFCPPATCQRISDIFHPDSRQYSDTGSPDVRSHTETGCRDFSLFRRRRCIQNWYCAVMAPGRRFRPAMLCTSVFFVQRCSDESAKTSLSAS